MVLVSPLKFRYNEQTARSNAFQNKLEVSEQEVRELAMKESLNLEKQLVSNGVEVLRFTHPEELDVPDATFPNNWFSTHRDGRIIWYPMCDPNRRMERSEKLVEVLSAEFEVRELVDWSHLEEQSKFLEGTGSMVIDHKNKIIYACLSNRTHSEPLYEIGVLLDHEVVLFNAFDPAGEPIYHTNVVMCHGQSFCLICLDSISDEAERNMVRHSILDHGSELITISMEQMFAFAGNMIQLSNKQGENLIVMSQTAFDSLNRNQIESLENHGKLVPASIPTIEHIGGGSVRCMIAENFLSPKTSSST